MAKKKSTKKKSSYPNSSKEHQSIILLLAGGLVVILCLYFLGADKFMPTKVYAPSSQSMQPIQQSYMNITDSPTPTSAQ